MLVYLRQTTRECVYLIKHGNFWLHDKDRGHIIRSTVAKKTHDACKLHGFIFDGTGVIANRSFTLRD